MLTGPAFIPPHPQAALVLLHGYGSDGTDLITLAPMLNQLLPDDLQNKVAFLAPHGVQPFPLGEGYQWFSDAGWTFRDKPGIDAATHALASYMQSEIIDKLGLNWTDVYICGFSQGAMLALYAASRLPAAVGGVIANAGVFMWEEDLPPTPWQPPVLLLHGREDDVVPADSTPQAAQALAARGVDVQHHLIDNLGHGLNEASLEFMAAALQTWQHQQHTT